jgi:hypothetical protein
MLHRLPRLNCLDLEATTKESSEAPLMALALELLNVRLPNIQQLLISVVGGWGDNPQPWKALGAASALTRLEVNKDGAAELTMGHLSALSGIGSSLQALVIDADRLVGPPELQQQQEEEEEEDDFEQDYAFLSALTALTELQLPLPIAAVNLAAISACSNLRNLSLSAFDEGYETAGLYEGDWDALGRLVQLTELRLPKVRGTGDSAAFRQLQELQALRVDGLYPDTALPVLASLPKLQELECYWGDFGEHGWHVLWISQAEAAVAPEHQLTALRTLAAEGHVPIPWAAFPQLRTVIQWDQFSTDNFAGICKHCTQLRELTSRRWRAGTKSLHDAESAAQRVAAIAALAKLPHLTLLHFGANDYAEIAALAAASQLQQLRLTVPKCNLRTGACR